MISTGGIFGWLLSTWQWASRDTRRLAASIIVLHILMGLIAVLILAVAGKTLAPDWPWRLIAILAVWPGLPVSALLIVDSLGFPSKQ